MVSRRPPAARIERTDRVPLAGLSDENFLIDFRDPGFDVDIRNDEIRSIEGKRHCPKELAAVTVESPNAAAFTDVDGNISNLSASNVRTNPLHEFWIRIHSGANEGSLFVDVLVPIVSRKVLVVP